jgi:hypothetical protein
MGSWQRFNLCGSIPHSLLRDYSLKTVNGAKEEQMRFAIRNPQSEISPTSCLCSVPAAHVTEFLVAEFLCNLSGKFANVAGRKTKKRPRTLR